MRALLSGPLADIYDMLVSLLSDPLLTEATQLNRPLRAWQPRSLRRRAP